jgi:hypothetical protein
MTQAIPPNRGWSVLRRSLEKLQAIERYETKVAADRVCKKLLPTFRNRIAS